MQYKWQPRTTQTLQTAGAQLRVLEYQAQPLEEPLSGYHQPVNRPAPFRQLQIDMQGGQTVLEPGALQWLRGDIDMEASATGGAQGGGLGGLLRGAVTAAATGEGLFKTVYRGAGSIYTEPTRLYYLLGELQGDDLIVDDGAFVTAAGQITVGRHTNRGLANMMGSGEGRVQPRLSGSGAFCLQSPVHPDEFQTLDLQGDTLKVDGNLVLAYTGSLEMTVERSARGLLGAGKTGEGFIQVYRGTGQIWLAPTLPLAARPSLGGSSSVAAGAGSLSEILGN
ncbi:AIM24 family protein [Deinococcus radiophilus]|uniref:AIM24 family protein n=1 Tax=Deinococcus radiophilus TaxID=32062 RepID=A0A431VGT6_9DEIO|nr:AIM24 family protein [Deinococcus radiophilus]RTR18960.1 AIM24 family protein [Deinococcus radiophilus]UFA50531.1 AIM24 family protein [Deinococcus radiophilus]